MSKKNQYPDYTEDVGEVKQTKKKKKGSGLLGRIVRRFFLVLFTIIILVLVALVLMANLIFKGPSPAAREILTSTLLEPSATKWIPALFIGEEAVNEIRDIGKNEQLASDVTDVSKVVINKNNPTASTSDEWANYPDGIRFADHAGDTYNAHIMIVRDPSRVYLGLSTYDGFSRNKPGKRINEAMEAEGAVAAVNAGAFFDNGKSGPEVGATPEGTVFSGGKCYWKTGAPPNDKGFAGFNKDDVLVVHKDNISAAKAEELNIRDGCCFGPVLIMDGEPNMEAYNKAPAWNPRTAIGQRADGAVIFVCIDGRQAGSIGGTFADMIDIMTEYGAVNACNMDGGSSSVMMYRDTRGIFGEAGQLKMINNYSLLQSEPRRMPNYWMVRPVN